MPACLWAECRVLTVQHTAAGMQTGERRGCTAALVETLTLISLKASSTLTCCFHNSALSDSSITGSNSMSKILSHKDQVCSNLCYEEIYCTFICSCELSNRSLHTKTCLKSTINHCQCITGFTYLFNLGCTLFKIPLYNISNTTQTVAYPRLKQVPKHKQKT